MSYEIPENLRYTDDHEWARTAEGVATIGITAYAQDQLGDITYIELPDVGVTLEKGDACGVIESVKTYSDIYAAVTGEVIEVNQDVLDAPETVNESPYEDGWLFKVRLTDDDEIDELLDADAYTDHIASL